jgi:predicted XRE-type DNA-binding protein
MNQVRKSSGNVFEDLGLPDSEGLLIKAELTSKIAELIEAANLTQIEAADKVEFGQPKVSALLRERFEGFSVERRTRILDKLGQEVKVVVQPKRAQDSRHAPKISRLPARR